MAGDPVSDAIDAAEPQPDWGDLDYAQLPRNDIGNAKRLIGRFGHMMICVDETGWYTFPEGGTHWMPPNAREHPEAVKQSQAMVAKIADEAVALRAELRDFKRHMPPPPLDEEGEVDTFSPLYPDWEKKSARLAFLQQAVNAHTKFGVGSGMAGKVEAALRMAAPMARRQPDVLDADDYLFNTHNGTLELGGKWVRDQAAKVFAIHNHDRDDLITHLSGVPFDPTAKCPEWDAFMLDIQPNANIRHFLQRCGGYSLTGDVREQKIFMCIGRGANGKSTFLDVAGHVLGTYAVNVPIETFLHDERRRGGEATPEIVRLIGARMAVASEPPRGARLGEDLVKRISGGTPIPVRRLFEGMTEFRARFKLWIDANMKPQIRGQDEGIWRRVLIIPFDTFIAPEKRDKTLADRLKATEGPGILNWFLEGLRIWRSEGLMPPDEVTAATEAYRMESDPIGEFITQCIERVDGSSLARGRMWDCYRKWCGINGIEPSNSTVFGRSLSDKGFERDKVGTVIYLNCRLTTEGEEIADSTRKHGPNEADIPGDHSAAPVDGDR